MDQEINIELDLDEDELVIELLQDCMIVARGYLPLQDLREALDGRLGKD